VSVDCHHYFPVLALYFRWKYIFNEFGKQWHSGSLSSIEIPWYNLSMYRQKSKQLLTLLRLDTIPCITSAWLHFGNSLGIGVRNRATNKGEPAIPMHHADIINLVDVRENSYGNRLKEFVLDQGINFLWILYLCTKDLFQIFKGGCTERTYWTRWSNFWGS